MTWRIAISVAIIMIWCLVLNHIAHQQTFKEQLVGTWSLESASPEAPKGRLVLEGSGGFAYLVVGRSSDSICTRTPAVARHDKAEAVSYFGTYTVNERDKTITLHIERGSSPDLNGTTQSRTIRSVTRDQLKYAAPAGAPEQAGCVWKRTKQAAGETPSGRSGSGLSLMG